MEFKLSTTNLNTSTKQMNNIVENHISMFPRETFKMRQANVNMTVSFKSSGHTLPLTHPEHNDVSNQASGSSDSQ